MMPTYVAIRLAAERQRELEQLAARRRLAHHTRASSCRAGRIGRTMAAVRRIAGSLIPRHRPGAVVRPLATTNTCCCAA